MSEEKKATFLSYKNQTGTEVCESIVELLGATPEKDIEDRIVFLTRHGCTDIVLLDADKQPIEKPK